MIDERDEERAATARHRQDKRTPFLIRESDAMLYPNTALMRKRPGFRPYHGDVRASLNDRQRYLQGLTARRDVKFDPEANKPEEFDLNAAGIEEILTFATEQYGVVLDPRLPLGKLRAEVYRLSQLSDEQLIHEIGGKGPAVDAQAAETASEGGADDPAAIAATVAASVAAQPAGSAVEPAGALRGGRQPRGTTAGKQRQAGVPAAA